MTEHPEQLPANNTIATTFRLSTPTTFTADTSCPHGAAHSALYQFDTRVPGAVALHTAVLRSHQLMVGCTCTAITYAGTANATVPPNNAIPAGATRTLATSAPVLSGNVFAAAGGKITTLIGYTARVTVSFSLSRSVSQGAVGVGHVLVNGSSVRSAQLVDVAGRATATVVWSGPLAPTSTIEAGYTNSSTQAQDVQTGSVLASAP